MRKRIMWHVHDQRERGMGWCIYGSGVLYAQRLPSRRIARDVLYHLRWNMDPKPEKIVPLVELLSRF